MILCLLISTLGVAVLNDHIYAVGGFDGSCGLNTAEVMFMLILFSSLWAGSGFANTDMCQKVLDMSVGGTHEWRSIASMSTRRSSVGVGVLQVFSGFRKRGKI